MQNLVRFSMENQCSPTTLQNTYFSLCGWRVTFTFCPVIPDKMIADAIL